MKQQLKYYVAYGSNLNLAQMKQRCPGAKLIGTGVVRGYELQFKGRSLAFATIGKAKDSTVPVGVWTISPYDEVSLDHYEGYPNHYTKQNISVEMDDGRTIEGMVYIMNPKFGFGLPTENYFATVYEGYEDCGLDTNILADAVGRSARAHYLNEISVPIMDEEDEVAGEDEDEDLEESEDEDDPFYSSEGIRWW